MYSPKGAHPPSYLFIRNVVHLSAAASAVVVTAAAVVAASAAVIAAAAAAAAVTAAAAEDHDKDDHPCTAIIAKKTIVTHKTFPPLFDYIP